LFAGIEAWTFEQDYGEAVFIPAGCPHQVRNLKVRVLLRFLYCQIVNGQDDKTTPKVLILTIGKPLLTFWNLNKVQEVKFDQVYL
jgi:hypothetical protein